jgi:uncharacterized glyoxalase superfamily protein PhnB
MSVSAVPYLSYPAAAEVIEWLIALGAETVTRQNGEGGTVLHSEIRLQDAVVMVASDDAAYTVPPLLGQSTGVGVYVETDRVDALFELAVEAGGRAVIAPEGTSWGARRARVLDPGGREWTFGSYVPGA